MCAEFKFLYEKKKELPEESAHNEWIKERLPIKERRGKRYMLQYLNPQKKYKNSNKTFFMCKNERLISRDIETDHTIKQAKPNQTKYKLYIIT